MAVHVRAGGSVGLVVTLVLFVLLWIGSTVAAIVAMANNNELEARRVTAEQDLRKYVNKATGVEEDKLVTDELNTQATSGDTVVRQLVNENQRLKSIIMGSPDAEYDAILTALQEADPNKANTPVEQRWNQGTVLTTEVSNLAQSLTLAQQENDRLRQEIADERAKRVAAEEARDTQNQDYSASVQQLTTTLSSKDQDLVTYRGQVDQQYATLSDRLANVQAEKSRRENELLGIVAQKNAEIALRDRRIADLIGGPEKRVEGLPSWKLPDGEVSSVLLEENVVFINRGKRDHVLLGLTFEVFSRKTGIVAEETGEFRGKGTVEVVSVSENSSVCRVVRVTRGQAIVEGDIIGNVVYDPQITFKFHVYGDFDIDNVGQASEVDRRRVETMIQDWGGKLTEALTYDVDFLVLGRDPDLPQRPEDQLDPVAMQRFAAEQKNYETYQQLLGEARSLKIPVLNQNRFLVLIGYYQR